MSSLTPTLTPFLHETASASASQRSTSIKKQKRKGPIHRVKSNIRRRRSAIRERYDRSIILLAEKFLNVPTEGSAGLLYSVPRIPSGYTRETLTQVFDKVLETMYNSESDTETVDSLSAKTLNWSNHSISPVSTDLADLLGLDIEKPSSLELYANFPSLEPITGVDFLSDETPLSTSQPLPPSGHSLRVARPCSEFLPEAVNKDGILIELEADSLSAENNPPNVSNTRTLSVDELFFGEFLDISIQPLDPNCRSYPATFPPVPQKCPDPVLQPRSIKNQENYCPRPSNPIEKYDQEQSNVAGGTRFTGGSPKPLSRRRGGADLQLQANVEITLTCPTPVHSPRWIGTSASSNVSSVLRDGTHTQDTHHIVSRSAEYIAYSPSDALVSDNNPVFPLALLEFPPRSLLDEINEELDNFFLMDWNGPIGTHAIDILQEFERSLLDEPIDDSDQKAQHKMLLESLPSAPTAVSRADVGELHELPASVRRPAYELDGAGQTSRQPPPAAVSCVQQGPRKRAASQQSSGPGPKIPARTSSQLPQASALSAPSSPLLSLRRKPLPAPGPPHLPTPPLKSPVSTSETLQALQREISPPSASHIATLSSCTPAPSSTASRHSPASFASRMHQQTFPEGSAETPLVLVPNYIQSWLQSNPTCDYPPTHSSPSPQSSEEKRKEVVKKESYHRMRSRRRKNGAQKFTWQRWVDRDWSLDEGYDDIEAKNASDRDKQTQEASPATVARAPNEKDRKEKEARRRGNLFEMLDSDV